MDLTKDGISQQDASVAPVTPLQRRPSKRSLKFDEKYNSGRHRFSLSELKADLEQIALAMEARFEIEDEVVKLAAA